MDEEGSSVSSYSSEVPRDPALTQLPASSTSHSRPHGNPSDQIPSHFTLAVTGRIESAELFGHRDIYCKYTLVYGSDWEFIGGIEEGVSQLTEKDSQGQFIWNFPLEMTFKSSNPHSWPQLVVSVYGSDLMGNHVVRGYCSTHLPLSQGSYTKILPLFVPESSSFLQKLSSWLLGRRPEFLDPKIVAQNEGRQLVRVNSGGSIRCKFDVVLKDFSKLKSFVLEHEKNDPLVFPVSPKQNPWQSKSKCLIT